MGPAQREALGIGLSLAYDALVWYQRQKLSRVGGPHSVPYHAHALFGILWPFLGPLSAVTLFQVCITYEMVPCHTLGMVLR